jgi:hypothetical protein
MIGISAKLVSTNWLLSNRYRFAQIACSVKLDNILQLPAIEIWALLNLFANHSRN